MEHEWEAAVSSRAVAGRGCPYCAGQKVTDDNRLSLNTTPELLSEWHPTRNGSRTPADVARGTDRVAWWQCAKGHEWKAVISSRAISGNGCPGCAGQMVTDDNRLSMKASLELLREWDKIKNGTRTPDDVSFGSHMRVWWKCKNGHEREAAVIDRYYGNGCRRCTLVGRSRVEVYLACELAAFFYDIDPSGTHQVRTAGGQYVNVDIVIRSENLLIEYDGAYWHKGRFDEDRAKTVSLKRAGWRVLRIREVPLKRIETTDLHCPVPSGHKDIKRLTEDVLTHLEDTFEIFVPDLDEYCLRASLINEVLADEIIGTELSDNRSEGPYQLPLCEPHLN